MYNEVNCITSLESSIKFYPKTLKFFFDPFICSEYLKCLLRINQYKLANYKKTELDIEL